MDDLHRVAARAHAASPTGSATCSTPPPPSPARFADLLEDNAHELDSTITAVATFIDGVDARASEVPEFISLIGSFFGRLSDVIRFDAPADKQMAGLRGFIALDLCLVYRRVPGRHRAAGAA